MKELKRLVADERMTPGVSMDDPRRLGKGRVRLVGLAPRKANREVRSGGRIHQFLWRRSRVVSKREKGTER